MEDEVDFKIGKTTKAFLAFAMGVFAFSLYMFLISLVNTDETGIEKYQENGAFFYTLNLANPANFFDTVDPITLIFILTVLIIVILLIIFSIIYLKINKIKKVQIEQQNKTVESIPVTPAPVESPPVENYSQYNNKVLELLEDGDKYLERKEYTNARIAYHKIKQWYDFKSDPTREIYFRIMMFYERIVKEEI